MLGCYGYALAWALCPLLGWGEYGFEIHYTNCTINWASIRYHSKSFVTALYPGTVLLSVGAMIVSYREIIKKVRVCHQNVGPLHRKGSASSLTKVSNGQ